MAPGLWVLGARVLAVKIQLEGLLKGSTPNLAPSIITLTLILPLLPLNIESRRISAERSAPEVSFTVISLLYLL